MQASTREELVADIQRVEAQLVDLRRRLAASFASQRFPEGEFSVLSCRCGTMSVGFLLDSVLEVVMMPQLNELPEAPPWAPGMLNLRGSSVPVVDVLARLMHTERKPEVADSVVVCRVEERLYGFVVQEVLDLDALQSGQVEAPGDGLTVAPYLAGVLHQGAEALLLLDVVSLVATSDLPAAAD